MNEWRLIGNIQRLLFNCETIEQMGGVILNVLFSVIPECRKAVLFLYDNGSESLKPFFGLEASESVNIEEYNALPEEILRKQMRAPFNSHALKYPSVGRASPFFEILLNDSCSMECRGDTVAEICSYFGFKNLGEFSIKSREKVLGSVIVDANCRTAGVRESMEVLKPLFSIYMDDLMKASYIEDMESRLETGYPSNMRRESLYRLGRASSWIAHEIKNAVIGVIGLFRRLEKYIKKDNKSENYIRVIEKELERIYEFVVDINQYAKGFKVNESVLFSVETIIEESMNAVGIPNSFVTVVTNIHPNARYIQGDPSQMKQVLINILKNSVEAIGKRKGKIWISTARNGDVVEIEIKDNAGGIEGEPVHNIFKPFYSTKSHGTGLGLAIVKQIILAHSGTVEAHNTTFGNGEKGLRFKIKLPLKTESGGVDGENNGGR